MVFRGSISGVSISTMVFRGFGQVFVKFLILGQFFKGRLIREIGLFSSICGKLSQ